ncbi:dihydrofolate reductase family protein [Devosia sp.]|uniref:dihydrofolate reductase family protein n=1 Tax=Devosia sp. TaxID=1871048 RepID=UPI001B2CD6EC|nr:dihydrofolate reductase family protein [Devosia sp.]MBO9589346.1 dihydrofolate reductase [Devosia sp.]
MPSAHVFIATSLDGYIARRNDDIDWLTSFSALGEDHGYNTHIARMDGIIMGRGTYEKVLTFDQWYYEKPVLVLSSSLDPASVPERLQGKVEIVNVTPEAAMDLAAARGWNRIYADGGKLIQSFLRAGFVEDMIISRIPILLGDGIPLFGPLDQDVGLEHIETKSFPSGLVQSHYRVQR